jgi:putative FmdB family regulatory protein
MPIYEYRCSQCGHQLEALQKISDAPLTSCPECQREALEKKVSAASFRLKGGGWYETDFKRDKKKNLADSAEGQAGIAAGSGKTEQQSGETGAPSSSKQGADKPAASSASKSAADSAGSNR